MSWFNPSFHVDYSGLLSTSQLLVFTSIQLVLSRDLDRPLTYPSPGHRLGHQILKPAPHFGGDSIPLSLSRDHGHPRVRQVPLFTDEYVRLTLLTLKESSTRRRARFPIVVAEAFVSPIYYFPTKWQMWEPKNPGIWYWHRLGGESSSSFPVNGQRIASAVARMEQGRGKRVTGVVFPTDTWSLCVGGHNSQSE